MSCAAAGMEETPRARSPSGAPPVSARSLSVGLQGASICRPPSAAADTTAKFTTPMAPSTRQDRTAGPPDRARRDEAPEPDPACLQEKWGVQGVSKVEWPLCRDDFDVARWTEARLMKSMGFKALSAATHAGRRSRTRRRRVRWTSEPAVPAAGAEQALGSSTESPSVQVRWRGLHLRRHLEGVRHVQVSPRTGGGQYAIAETINVLFTSGVIQRRGSGAASKPLNAPRSNGWTPSTTADSPSLSGESRLPKPQPTSMQLCKPIPCAPAQAYVPIRHGTRRATNLSKRPSGQSRRFSQKMSFLEASRSRRSRSRIGSTSQIGVTRRQWGSDQ